MGSGRVKIRPKVGFYYTTDSGKIIYIIKKLKTLYFPYLGIDEEGTLHRYTAKGRYTRTLENNPMHLRKEYPNGRATFGDRPITRNKTGDG